LKLRESDPEQEKGGATHHCGSLSVMAECAGHQPGGKSLHGRRICGVMAGMEFFTSAIRHYADFKGRCSRKPFWMFVVTTHICLMLLFTPLLMAATGVYCNLLIGHPDFNTFAESLALQDDFTQVHAEILCDMFCDIAQEGAELLLAEHLASVVCAGIGVLLGLFLFVPSLSITVRRMRDAAQSPWWVYLSLMSFLPLPIASQLGALFSIVVFILCWLPSKPAAPLPESGGVLPPV